MKNKIAAVVLASVILAGVCVYAEPNVTIDGSLVTVTANIEPDSKAMLFAVKAGASLDDDTGVFAIREGQADKDGKVQFSFGIPAEKNSQATDGEYIIYAKQTGREMKIGNFFYAQPEKRETVLDGITSGSVADTLNNAENEIALKSLGIDMDVYSGFSDAQKTDALRIYGANPENGVDVLNKAILIEQINIDTSDASDTYIKNMNFSFEDVDYQEIEDEEVKKFITDYIYNNRNYASFDDIQKAYDRANILTIVNKTRFTAMEDTLSKYAETLGISGSAEYARYLSCTVKETADKNLVTILMATPAKSVPELLAAINKSIPVVYTGGGSSGGGSSSGGGGSSNVLGGSSSQGSVPGISSTTPNSTINTPSFSDISNAAWAEEAILSLAKKGIVSGDGDGKFYPMRELTREEFVKMLVTAANLYDKNSECEFDDVGKDKWYYSYVASAVKYGLVSGISETEFGSGRALSRQDMAVMCLRATDGIKTLNEVREYTPFADESSIKDYAKDSVIKLYSAGIVNGVDYESFAPEMGATRAQAAVIIYNLFK